MRVAVALSLAAIACASLHRRSQQDSIRRVGAKLQARVIRELELAEQAADEADESETIAKLSPTMRKSLEEHAKRSNWMRTTFEIERERTSSDECEGSVFRDARTAFSDDEIEPRTLTVEPSPMSPHPGLAAHWQSVKDRQSGRYAFVESPSESEGDDGKSSSSDDQSTGNVKALTREMEFLLNLCAIRLESTMNKVKSMCPPAARDNDTDSKGFADDEHSDMKVGDQYFFEDTSDMESIDDIVGDANIGGRSDREESSDNQQGRGLNCDTDDTGRVYDGIGVAVDVFSYTHSREHIVALQAEHLNWTLNVLSSATRPFMEHAVIVIADNPARFLFENALSAYKSAMRYTLSSWERRKAILALPSLLQAMEVRFGAVAALHRRIFYVLGACGYSVSDAHNLTSLFVDAARFGDDLRGTLVRNILEVHSVCESSLTSPFAPSVWSLLDASIPVVTWPYASDSVDLWTMATHLFASRLLTDNAHLSSTGSQLLDAAWTYAELTCRQTAHTGHGKCSLVTMRAVAAMHVRDILAAYVSDVSPLRTADGFGAGMPEDEWKEEVATQLAIISRQPSRVSNAFWTDRELQVRFNAMRVLNVIADGDAFGEFVRAIYNHVALLVSRHLEVTSHLNLTPAFGTRRLVARDAEMFAPVVSAARIFALRHGVETVVAEAALLDAHVRFWQPAELDGVLLHGGMHRNAAFRVVFNVDLNSIAFPSNNSPIALLRAVFAKDLYSVDDVAALHLFRSAASQMHCTSDCAHALSVLGVSASPAQLRSTARAMWPGESDEHAITALLAAIPYFTAVEHGKEAVDVSAQRLAEFFSSQRPGQVAEFLRLMSPHDTVPHAAVLLVLRVLSTGDGFILPRAVHAVLGDLETVQLAQLEQLLRSHSFPDDAISYFLREEAYRYGGVISVQDVVNRFSTIAPRVLMLRALSSFELPTDY